MRPIDFHKKDQSPRFIRSEKNNVDCKRLLSRIAAREEHIGLKFKGTDFKAGWLVKNSVIWSVFDRFCLLGGNA